MTIFTEKITVLPKITIIHFSGSIVNVVSTLQMDLLVWPHTAQNILMWNLE